jgi:hypothetical protein
MHQLGTGAGLELFLWVSFVSHPAGEKLWGAFSGQFTHFGEQFA